MFLIAVAAVAAALITWVMLRWLLPAPGQAASGSTPRPVPAAPRQPQHLLRRLGIGIILTLPTLVIYIIQLAAPTAVPAPLTSPWLHAILVTPVMFYCGSPIHHTGIPALRRRTPDGSTLISLGTWIMYLCCLAVCGVPHAFPDAPHEPLFLAVDSIINLTLAVHLPACSRNVTPEPSARTAAAYLARAVPPVAMSIAVWTFALWVALTPQTVLPQGLIATVNVMIILYPCTLLMPEAASRTVIVCAAVYAVITVPIAAGILVPFGGWLPDPTVTALVATAASVALLSVTRHRRA